MLCDKCHAKEATLHFRQEIEGEVIEMHLCEDCMQHYNIHFEILPHSAFAFPISIAKFIEGIEELKFPKAFLPSSIKDMAPVVKPSKRCSECKLSYAEFKESGKLGCSNCYSTFSQELQRILRKLHGNNIQHVGKLPSRVSPSLSIQRDITLLKKKLEQAIKKEEYEEAAKIRDKIKILENNLNKKEVKPEKNNKNSSNK
jgi:protein arginine kinase activator